jgi:hypothetical protein
VPRPCRTWQTLLKISYQHAIAVRIDAHNQFKCEPKGSNVQGLLVGLAGLSFSWPFCESRIDSRQTTSST